VTAEEQSKATTTVMLGKDVARRYRNQLKASLEALDQSAEMIVSDLRLEELLLPRNAYIGAPGTYARHVYNILREVAGR
jgi:hypothetical protein